MSETCPSTSEKEEEVKVGKLDLNALADAFEAQGNVIEAKKYRDLARRQPELEKLGREEMSAHLDKIQQEQKPKQSEIRSLQPHERADAAQVSREAFEKKIRGKVEEMLQVKGKY